MRLNADFDNFRKRTAAEKEALRASVKGDTVMASSLLGGRMGACTELPLPPPLWARAPLPCLPPRALLACPQWLACQ